MKRIKQVATSALVGLAAGALVTLVVVVDLSMAFVRLADADVSADVQQESIRPPGGPNCLMVPCLATTYTQSKE